MHRLPFTCVEAGIAALILVPLFLALRMCYGLSWRRTAGYLLFSVYLAAVDSVVGLPSITYIRFSLNLNLEPFAYMFSDYVTSLLNVILFTPLGLLLPLFCQTFRKLWRTAVFGLLFSLSIELLQIFHRTVETEPRGRAIRKTVTPMRGAAPRLHAGKCGNADAQSRRSEPRMYHTTVRDDRTRLTKKRR